MTRPPDRPTNGAPRDPSGAPFDQDRDADLARAWSAQSRELPPPALDQAILAAAHRAVNAGPRDVAEPAALARRPQRWWMPLAAAAVIGVVAIGIVQVTPEQELLTPHEKVVATPRAPAADKAVAQNDARKQDATRPTVAADAAPAPAGQRARAEAPSARRDSGSAPSPASAVAEPAPAVAAPAAPAAPPIASPPVPAARPAPPAPEPFPGAAPAPAPAPERKVEAARTPANEARDERQVAGAGASNAAPPPVPAPSAALAPPPPSSAPMGRFAPTPSAASRDAAAPADTTRGAPMPMRSATTALAKSSEGEARAKARDPDAWLARIRKLRDDGDIATAERELREFRQLVPDADARIPADMRAWAATVR